MARDFYIKTGDLLPSIAATLTNVVGEPLNLTGSTVTFWMRPANEFGATPLGGVAMIVDAVAGKVRYDWRDGETDISGDYFAEFRIVNSAGKSMTYPNNKYILVQVMRGLG